MFWAAISHPWQVFKCMCFFWLARNVRKTVRLSFETSFRSNCHIAHGFKGSQAMLNIAREAFYYRVKQYVLNIAPERITWRQCNRAFPTSISSHVSHGTVSLQAARLSAPITRFADVSVMAAYEGFLTSIYAGKDIFRPTFFELIAQEQLSEVSGESCPMRFRWGIWR